MNKPNAPLYVSDLDGTLLSPDGTLSAYSRTHLNQLIEDGLLFSVATARCCPTCTAGTITPCTP